MSCRIDPQDFCDLLMRGLLARYLLASMNLLARNLLARTFATFLRGTMRSYELLLCLLDIFQTTPVNNYHIYQLLIRISIPWNRLWHKIWRKWVCEWTDVCYYTVCCMMCYHLINDYVVYTSAVADMQRGMNQLTIARWMSHEIWGDKRGGGHVQPPARRDAAWSLQQGCLYFFIASENLIILQILKWD